MNKVIFGEDFVQIKINKKELYWNQDEWVEDPSVVFSICNAIHLFYTNINLLKEVV